MAQNFYSIATNETMSPANVTAATSAPTADVYVQVLTTNNPDKTEVIQALECIMQFLLSQGLESGSPGTDMPPL
jgi:ribosome-binding factor A